LRVERINWDDPPNWADEWDHNPMVVDAEAENPAKPSQGGDDALEELKKLAGDLA
jgi:hypothetical protein